MAAFGDLLHQTLRVVFDDCAKQSGFVGGGQDGVVSWVQQTQDQVVAQTAGKQTTLLLQKAHVLGQHRFADVRKVQLVQQHPTFLRFVHAREQAQQGGFARANGPQDAHFFASLNL